MILFALEAQGPRSQGQLAVACGCEPPTITNSVRKLEAAGLVVRRQSPADGRVSIVALSRQGRDLMPRLNAAWQELAQQSVAGLTTTSVDVLIEALIDLATSLRTTDD